MIISCIVLKLILLKKNYDFDNGIELIRKIQSGEIRLEDAKELQNILKSYLNETIIKKI